jgi:hypothetical protein
LASGAALAATFDGTQGDDRFIGTPEGDRAVMRAGDDFARGFGDSDFFFGNAGNDELYGDAGSDLLNGGIGDDLLVGGTREDELIGHDGDDTIYTGTLTEGDRVSDEVQCGAGYDVVYLSGGDHASHNTQAGFCEEIHQYSHGPTPMALPGSDLLPTGVVSASPQHLPDVCCLAAAPRQFGPGLWPCARTFLLRRESYEAARWLPSLKSATFFLGFPDLSVSESTSESVSESTPL